MFKRVMVAVVGIPFLLLVLGWVPEWATTILVAGMCAIGAWELMRAVAGERGKPLIPLTVLAAAVVPVCVSAELSIQYADLTAMPQLPVTALAGVIFVLLAFALAIHRYDESQGIPFAAVTAALFAGLVFPLMLSCLLRLRMVPFLGEVLVFMPLCIAFGSDTFALFAGMLCGKHKLAPRVSPKKTVEGAVGGLIGGVIGMTLMAVIGGMVLGDAFLAPVHVLVFGIVGSAVSQIGDLSFSVIKREFGVKDYGNLLPGHGGILDRFDSVTFVAPFVWLALQIMWVL